MGLFQWGAAVSLRMLGRDRRALILASQRRRCVQMLVPVLAAAFCVQALAGCVPGAMVSDDANLGTPIRPGAETPIPVPGRALLKAQSEPDCEFQLIGLGDTWLDTDD